MQFASCMKTKKEDSHLFTVIQKKDESLKSYTQRFMREKIRVPNCNESFDVKALHKGMIKSQPLYDHLMIENPTSMSKVLCQANKFMKLEDDKQQGQKEKAKKTMRDSQGDEFLTQVVKDDLLFRYGSHTLRCSWYVPDLLRLRVIFFLSDFMEFF